MGLPPNYDIAVVGALARLSLPLLPCILSTPKYPTQLLHNWPEQYKDFHWPYRQFQPHHIAACCHIGPFQSIWLVNILFGCCWRWLSLATTLPLVALTNIASVFPSLATGCLPCYAGVPQGFSMLRRCSTRLFLFLYLMPSTRIGVANNLKYGVVKLN